MGRLIFCGRRSFSEARRACLVAPQGFEPRLIGSEPTVLPLNEEATSIFTTALRSFTAPHHFSNSTDSMGFGQCRAVEYMTQIPLCERNPHWIRGESRNMKRIRERLTAKDRAFWGNDRIFRASDGLQAVRDRVVLDFKE